MEDYPNEEHVVQILSTENVTHNVKHFKLSKPDSYHFTPGQATDIVINLPGWKEERRPFTFTSLNDWDYLEFTIKIYDNRKIDESYLKEKINDFSQYFYICGPDAMIESVSKDLQKLGVHESKIVIEQF